MCYDFRIMQKSYSFSCSIYLTQNRCPQTTPNANGIIGYSFENPQTALDIVGVSPVAAAYMSKPIKSTAALIITQCVAVNSNPVDSSLAPVGPEMLGGPIWTCRTADPPEN